MADVLLTSGDRLPELVVVLRDSTGTAVSLAANPGAGIPAATVRFLMRPIGIATPVIAEDATVVDAAAGRVKYVWQEGETAVAGFYEAEFEATWGLRTQTFPTGTPLLVQIRGQIG